jgi:malonate-semialdehyde dehydrogenase (acetylating)/methylmalonate-semialdehyde dehydrogenase
MSGKDQATMTETVTHVIDGARTRDAGGRYHPAYNPATGEQTESVALASAAEVERAIRSARAALSAWAAKTPLARARIMFKFKELIERHHDELARAISRQHGKLFHDAKGEVTRGLEVVEFACGAPHLLKGEFSPQVGTGVDSFSMRQPLGVCAGITPFNFPAMVPMWMFPVALVCGNTFVLKPSERDPAAPMMLADLLHEAGLPPGVFNVVNGDKEAVDTLLTTPDVQAVSFVGSTPIAEYIYTHGCAHGKRVQALGGAKNHAIVMPDADMDQAANALMGAAYGSAGERCMSISAVVTVGDAGDRFMETFAPKVRNLRIGPYDDPDADMGPLVTADHLQKVRAYVDIGVDEGAELVVDGRDVRLQGHENGNFMGGCLFDRVTSDMRVYQEEIFGPVLSVLRADSFDEACALVNNHQYGNGTAIFTRDGDAAQTFAHTIQAGMVGINVPIPVPMAFHSFGGWKRSIFGDHGAHGPEAVHFYTRLKTVTQRWPTGVRQGPEFVMPTLG